MKFGGFANLSVSVFLRFDCLAVWLRSCLFGWVLAIWVDFDFGGCVTFRFRVDWVGCLVSLDFSLEFGDFGDFCCGCFLVGGFG